MHIYVCVGPSSVVKEVGGMPDYWPLSGDHWSVHTITTEGQASYGPDQECTETEYHQNTLQVNGNTYVWLYLQKNSYTCIQFFDFKNVSRTQLVFGIPCTWKDSLS